MSAEAGIGLVALPPLKLALDALMDTYQGMLLLYDKVTAFSCSMPVANCDILPVKSKLTEPPVVTDICSATGIFAVTVLVAVAVFCAFTITQAIKTINEVKNILFIIPDY
jgi:hypothetical protein